MLMIIMHHDTIAEDSKWFQVCSFGLFAWLLLPPAPQHLYLNELQVGAVT
jgi:hypothetical protein